MLCSLTRRMFAQFRDDFLPLFGQSVQDAHGVEVLLFITSSAKDDYVIMLSIIVHGASGSLRRNLSAGLVLSPL